MKYEILAALMRFDETGTREIEYLVDSFWDGLDHQNEAMLSRYHMAESAEIALTDMWWRSGGLL